MAEATSTNSSTILPAIKSCTPGCPTWPLLRRDQQRLRDALAESDVSFIVTPIEAEAHFIRDLDGVVRDAGEVERRRARMRRDFGVDVE